MWSRCCSNMNCVLLYLLCLQSISTNLLQSAAVLNVNSDFQCVPFCLLMRVSTLLSLIRGNCCVAGSCTCIEQYKYTCAVSEFQLCCLILCIINGGILPVTTITTVFDVLDAVKVLLLLLLSLLLLLVYDTPACWVGGADVAGSVVDVEGSNSSINSSPAWLCGACCLVWWCWCAVEGCCSPCSAAPATARAAAMLPLQPEACKQQNKSKIEEW